MNLRLSLDGNWVPTTFWVCWALADPEQNAYVGSSGTLAKPWPHLRQIVAVERHRLQVRRGQIVATEAEVRYYVTSLAPADADAKALLALIRGHWGIENRLHYVRDVTFEEDRSQMRSGAIPQTFAACRNLVIGLLRPTGFSAAAGEPPARSHPVSGQV